MSADNSGVIGIPTVITHRPPHSIDANLHSAFISRLTTLAGCAHFPDSLDNSRRLDHFLLQICCCWYRHIHLYGGVYLCNMLRVVVLQLYYHCHTHKRQCLCSRICGSILEIATIFTTIISSYNNSYTNSGIYSTD